MAHPRLIDVDVAIASGLQVTWHMAAAAAAAALLYFSACYDQHHLTPRSMAERRQYTYNVQQGPLIETWRLRAEPMYVCCTVYSYEIQYVSRFQNRPRTSDQRKQ